MGSYWKGEKSLTKTFWFLWVFGSLAIAVTLSLFAYLLRFIIPFPTTELSLVVFLFLILFLNLAAFHPQERRKSVTVKQGAENTIV